MTRSDDSASHRTEVDLSIILVSYDSLSDLQRCLPTIIDQSVTWSYEIIVVDNHRSDGVAEWLRRTYPAIHLVVNPHNTGYAGGNNLGLKRARGQWSFLLNPDVELRPGSLAQLIDTARQHPHALINPKLLHPDGTINACGNQMHYTGITTCRGQYRPGSELATLHPIPLLSGAAIVGQTAVIREIGGFDERYFMYFEDTDLSLRARQCGIALLCEGRSEIVHHYRLNLSADKFYYLERNRLLTFLKLFPRRTLVALLPALILTELATWAYGLRGWSYLKSRFRTYGYLWENRRAIRSERARFRQSAPENRGLLSGSELALPLGSITPPPFDRIANVLTKNLFRLLIPGRLRQ